MNYNWDTIQTGRPELNSSQNFFRVRHALHERDAQAIEESNQITTTQQQKNIAPPKKFNGTETVTNAIKATSIQHQNSGDKENVSTNNNNRAIMAITIVKKPPASEGGRNKPTMLKNVLKKSTSVPLPGKQPQLAPKSFIVQKPGPSSTVVSQAVVKRADVATIGQRQQEYAEQAKKRKEQLILKITAEKEKELNVKFTANPAPKFKKVSVVTKQPSQLVKQNSLPQLNMISKKYTSKENIVPSCGDPERLKLMEEKKKMNLAKYQEQHVQFKAKPAAVLKKQPFQPVHNVLKPSDSKPFNLHLADRLLMRSEFDRKLYETIAIRKKQEEIRKRMADFEERKILRQKTEFRANPVPRNIPRKHN